MPIYRETSPLAMRRRLDIFMKQIFIACILIGMLMLAGCGENSESPTSPTRNSFKGASQPTDDTYDSEITPPAYPAGTIVIAAIGDSITYGVGSNMGGYPAILEQKLRAAGHNVVVLNAGVPGEISPETDERLLETIANVDIALLMIGTNDVINHRGDYNTIEEIEGMMDKMAFSNVVPLVSTIPPAAPSSDYAWANYRIEPLNAEITAAAAERAKSVYLVDNYVAIWNNGGDALYVDRLHFNDRGYTVIAEQWFNCLIANKILEKFKKKS